MSGSRKLEDLLSTRCPREKQVKINKDSNLNLVFELKKEVDALNDDGQKISRIDLEDQIYLIYQMYI